MATKLLAVEVISQVVEAMQTSLFIQLIVSGLSDVISLRQLEI